MSGERAERERKMLSERVERESSDRERERERERERRRASESRPELLTALSSYLLHSTPLTTHRTTPPPSPPLARPPPPPCSLHNTR